MSLTALCTYSAFITSVPHLLGLLLRSAFVGRRRRIVRDESGSSGVLRHFYYHERWQRLEERFGTATTADREFIWHQYYIDALAASFDDSGTLNYQLHDANFNVTAATTGGGTVVERCNNTPYGEVTILNGSSDADGADWTEDTNGSGIGDEFLYTGRRLDPETGLQYNRERYYHQQLGRWLTRDPIGYLAGDLNLYGYVGGMPPYFTDPVRLEICRCECRTANGNGIGGATGPKQKIINDVPANQTCAAACAALSFRSGGTVRSCLHEPWTYPNAFDHFLSRNPDMDACYRRHLRRHWLAWRIDPMDSFGPRDEFGRGCVGITGCYVGRPVSMPGDAGDCYDSLAAAQAAQQAANENSKCCESRAVIIAFRWNDQWDGIPTMSGPGVYDFGYYDETCNGFWHATLSEATGGRPLLSSPDDFTKGKRKTIYCIVCESNDLIDGEE